MFSSLLADGKEKKRLCFAKNLSYSLSLPWLKWVLLSHAWPKIRRRRKGALSALISLFFGSSEGIKEETAKASLLLVNMKGTDDKTWKRDQHLMP